MNKRLSLLAGSAALAASAALALGTPAHAAAGFIALEGSDATAFHHDGIYSPELFKYLQGPSSKNVLVLGPNYGLLSGSVPLTYTPTLTGVTLSDYSALYIEAPGTCCTADPTAINGFGGAVSTFIAGGGNLSIQNYIGGDYDGVILAGVGPGSPRGSAVSPSYFCSDGETVTALGIAKGFSQPPIDGCWSHEAYDNAYWGAKGYVDLIHADPTFFGGNGSSFLAFGGTLGSKGVPEPATWAMMLIGFGGMGAVLRSRRRAAMATA
jgi:hypothetical protein